MDQPGQRATDPEVLLRQLRQQLERTQSLAAVGELTSTATHEFNNVLMTVINYAKLGMRHRDDATRDKALKKILDAAERAATITQTILGAARNRSESMQPTELGPLVRDCLVLLEREMRKYRVMVETDLADAPPVMASGNQIQRVLINLLINARQAMPSGGSVRVAVAHDAGAGQVTLSVRDTGCGIPADRLPRIFDSFYTTKQGPDASGKGGTGLGLAACRDIVQAHGGKIRVESTVGRGTAFHIRLPIASAAEQAA